MRDLYTETRVNGFVSWMTLTLPLWSATAPTWSIGVRPADGVLTLPWLLERIRAGVVPEAGGHDEGNRVRQLAAAGYDVRDAQDRPPSLGETEVADVLRYAKVLWWPQVVVPIPGKPLALPYRLDFLVLGRFVDDREGAEQRWALFALEVDGPLHDAHRDRRRDDVVMRYGVPTFRVPTAWAVTDPWATVSHVLARARVRQAHETANVVPLESPEAYRCYLCAKPIQRRDRGDLDVLSDFPAHSDCSERAMRFAERRTANVASGLPEPIGEESGDAPF